MNKSIDFKKEKYVLVKAEIVETFINWFGKEGTYFECCLSFYFVQKMIYDAQSTG